MIVKSIVLILFLFLFSTGVGVNTDIGNPTRKHSKMLKIALFCISMHALLKLFDDLLTDLGVL